MTIVPDSSSRPEIAFYYPGTFWYSAGWVKSLLLFFDGVSLLVPSYMQDRADHVEPEMVFPLREKGLLTVIEPETAVDKTATEQLASALTNVIASGALDQLSRDGSDFHELSWSRLGGYGDEGLARMILDELKSRGLARDSEDGVSIPMHPLVRSLVLVFLSQILRPYGQSQGLDLSPATDRPQLVGALQELLNLDASPAAGQVVTLDLQAVGVDLANVPLDDVLGFREEHRAQYRQYATSVRRFVRDVSLVPHNERGREFEARRQEILELGEAIKRASTKTWKRAARFALGITGAAWAADGGNALGAALGIGGAVLAFESAKAETGAYSYIFKAREQYA